MSSGFRNLCIATLCAAAVAGCEPAGDADTGGSTDRVRLAEYENYKDFGDFVLHVNGLGTNQLPPEVARAAGIVRSDNRGMLNVVILEKLEAQEDRPVSGEITVSAANLAGQFREIDMRKVVDQDAIYYIGEFAVSHRETLVFDIDVVPENEGARLAIRYTKEFYTK